MTISATAPGPDGITVGLGEVAAPSSPPVRRPGRVPTVVGAARRRVVAVLAGLVLVAGAGLVVYRVFAPGEVLAEPTVGYPAAPTPRPPAVLGTLPSAPLIVEGRLRVVADKRQVRADGPVDSRYLNTPYWSFRRWPAELVGVVAAGGTVVTRWSDGELVGLDARTGRDIWRAKGEKPVIPGYAGRRTGAPTVYAPPGLFLAGDTVVVAGATSTQAYDGRRPAQPAGDSRPSPARLDPTRSASPPPTAGWRCCAPATKRSGCSTPAPARPPGRSRSSEVAPETTLEPLDCAGSSFGLCRACGSTTSPRGRPGSSTAGETRPRATAEDGRPARRPGCPARRRAGRRARGHGGRHGGGGVRRRPTAGSGGGTTSVGRTPRSSPCRPAGVYVLTADRDLVTLDAATGAEISRIRYTYFAEKTDWVPGYSYAVAGYRADRAPGGPGGPGGRRLLLRRPAGATRPV